MVGPGRALEDPPPANSGALCESEFAAQFEASFRKFWLVAVSVVRDHALAEDIVQEAAIVALGKLDQFQAGTSFAAWMGTMVRYVALNHARREQKRKGKTLDDQHMPAPAADATQGSESGGLEFATRGLVHVDPEQFDDRIVRTLDRVSDMARACLLLRTVEGMRYSEIGELLGVPEGTAMSHVHRTRQILREQLSDLSPSAGSGTEASS